MTKPVIKGSPNVRDAAIIGRQGLRRAVPSPVPDNAEAQSLSNNGRLAVHLEDEFFRAAAVAILTPGL
jgi:predicted nucleic acid-binding Zn ribbon protein